MKYLPLKGTDLPGVGGTVGGALGLPGATGDTGTADAASDEVADTPDVSLAPIMLSGRGMRRAQRAGQLPLPGFAYAELSGVGTNQEAGDAREAVVKAQLQAEYPGAQIYAERAIRGVDQQKLTDPQTGKGRRFDFVVQGGQIADIVEVTAPDESKAEQFGKTRRILDANPGNAYN